MNEATVPTNQSIADINVQSFTDLRSAGLAPREIHRLQQLRDSLRYFPQLEFFTNEQWCRLLFLKWRYDHGEFAEDMPPASRAESGESANITG